jgi:hypothetical protein
MKYSIVAIYTEEMEAVVDHVEADTVETALIKFYNDAECGYNRKKGCKIVSVFEGHMFDQIAECRSFSTDDLLTYDEHIKPLENK